MANSKFSGRIMILSGVVLSLITWFAWNYGKINFPVDFSLYILSLLAVLAGLAIVFLGEKPAQERQLGLRACGVFLALFGLFILVVAFAEGALIQQARQAGKAVAGYGAVIMMIFGIAILFIGVGVITLRKIAIISTIPLVILMILGLSRGLYQGEPISMGLCLVFLLIIGFSVSYLVKSRRKT